MLGRRGEGGLDFCGTGNDDGGHAVNPPVPGGASQLSKDAVHRLDEMRLVHRLADLCAYPSRVRQGAEQHVGGPSLGSVPAFEPVPLDLLSGGMGDLRGIASFHAIAGLAVRAELGVSHLADEARVAERVSKARYLVIEGACPHVGIVAKALGEVGNEGFERIRQGSLAHPWLALL